MLLRVLPRAFHDHYHHDNNLTLDATVVNIEHNDDDDDDDDNNNNNNNSNLASCVHSALLSAL